MFRTFVRLSPIFYGDISYPTYVHKYIERLRKGPYLANVLTSCDHPQNEKLPHKIFNKHDDLVNDKASLPALPLKATAIRKSGEACKRSYKKGQIFFLRLLLAMNHLRVEE